MKNVLSEIWTKDDVTNDITCLQKSPKGQTAPWHKMYTGLWQESLKSDILRCQQNYFFFKSYLIWQLNILDVYGEV